MATPCFHPSSSLEAVSLVNGPLPSFSNTLSRFFPVFSSMHHQHHFLCFLVFSSSLPTPFSFPISCFVFLSLSQVPVHTPYSTGVTSVSPKLLFSQQKPHSSSFSPYFSKRQKSVSHLTTLLCTLSRPSFSPHSFSIRFLAVSISDSYCFLFWSTCSLTLPARCLF